jgi:hypothetical protein
MTDKKKGSVWQKLDWAKKVEICMQGIDHEDTLLITFVLIFIALEAMFFAVIFNMKLCFCLNLIIAVLGILVAVQFAYFFKRRGDYVDNWGTILYELWNEASLMEEKESGVRLGASEFVKHYEGCMERKKRGSLATIFGWKWFGLYSGSKEERKGKFGWLAVIRKRKGWFQPLKSPRWMLVPLMPFLVILVWVLVMVATITGAFN